MILRTIGRKFRSTAALVPQPARMIMIGILGALLLLVGIVLLPLPGPGSLIMAAGLAVLAIEFSWARRALRRCKVKFFRSWQRVRLLAEERAARCRWIAVPVIRGRSKPNH